MVSSLYAGMALVCIAVLAVFLNRTLNFCGSSEMRGRFVTLLIFSIIYCSVDAIWGLVAVGTLNTKKEFFTAISYGFFSMSMMASFVWAIFAMYFAGERIYKCIPLRIVIGLIAIAQCVLIVMNYFTHELFIVDADGTYSSGGPMRLTVFLLQVADFCIMGAVAVIGLAVARSNAQRRTAGVAVTFSALPFFGGVFQYLYPNIPFYSVGFMLSCLTIYSFSVQTEHNAMLAQERSEEVAAKYREELERNQAVINALTGAYGYVCIVDAKKNTITNFSVNGIFRNFIADGQKEICSADFDEMLRTLVPPEELDSFIASVNRDNLLAKLSRHHKVTCDFRINYAGKYYNYRMNFALNPHNEGEIIIGMMDVSEEIRIRREKDKVMYMASTDGLTGLLNKTAFVTSVNRLIFSGGTKNSAFIYMDIDNFKDVNDRFDHSKGDDALKDFAVKLKKQFRQNELIARMGGDEFAVYMPNVTEKVVHNRINKLHEVLREVYTGDGKSVTVSASIGCIYCMAEDADYDYLHGLADHAMYEVKRSGKDGYVIKKITSGC